MKWIPSLKQQEVHKGSKTMSCKRGLGVNFQQNDLFMHYVKVSIASKDGGTEF